MIDSDTKLSKCYGFVDSRDEYYALAAIRNLNNRPFVNRKLMVVREATEEEAARGF